VSIDVKAEHLADRVLARRARVHLILGPAGIGKTTLTAAIANRLRDKGHPILPVVALAELSNVPLGAFAPVLSSMGGTGDLGERLQQLYAAAAPVGAPQILLVDDAPHLDAVSAAAVQQLVRVYGLRCIMAARRERDLGGPLRRLIDEGYVETTTVAPLTPEAARALVAQLQSAPLDPERLRTLLRRAAGNPRYLRELAFEAASDAPIPARIRDSVRERFSGLSAPARRIAELLAVTAPWRREHLTTVDGLADLVEDDLVTAGPSGTIALAHPLYEEVLRESLEPAALEARRIDAARLLAAAGDAASRSRAVALLAHTAEAPPTAEVAAAASAAYARRDNALTLDLAEVADELARRRHEPPSAEAISARAAVLSESGRLDEADLAFEAALGASHTDSDYRFTAIRAGIHYAHRRGRPDRGAAFIEAILPSIAEPATRRDLLAEAEKWRFRVGGDAGANADEPDDPAASINLHLLRSQRGIYTGRLGSARQSIDRIRALAPMVASTETIRHAPELADIAEWLVRLLEADVERSKPFALSKQADLFDEAGGVWSYALAYHALVEGDYAVALVGSGEAIERLLWRDIVGALGPARAVRATAAAAQGARELARGLIREYGDRPTDVPTGLQFAEAEAWLRHLDGEDDAAAAGIAEAVTPAVDPSHPTWATISAHLAVRFGRPLPVLPAIRRAAELAPEVPLVGAIRAHAEALIEHDGDALLAAARRLAAAGFRAGAADAARQAVTIGRASDDAALVRRASRLAAATAPGGIQRHDAAAELSAREYEIAIAAARRRRNREIAEELGISVRTVENHLANAFRKLGVANRDELAARIGVRPEAMGG